jgi:phage terminase large subunit
MMAQRSFGDFYRPQPMQARFHASGARYPLMEGGRGGGKSIALLIDAIRCCNDVPAANCLLLRRTLTSSEKGGIEDHFLKYVPKWVYQSFNGSSHTVHFANGSKLFFGHIKADVDLLQYQGPEYLYVGWDELTQFTYSQWSFLKGSNRCPVKISKDGRPVRPRMAAATNPNGKGSGWVKALWIQKKLPAGIDDPTYDPKDYETIHSTFRDNAVYANDAEYIAGLASQPPAIRQAWLEGSWDILAGQFFSNWEEARHVKAAVTFQDWQPRWIGIDWGFNHATCVLWFTVAKTTNALGESRDTIVCYRELVRRGLNEQALADEIVKYNSRDKIANVYLSPERFNRISEEHTIADRIGDIFVSAGLPRPDRANNERIGGWRLIYTLLDTEGFVVTPNCRDLIDSIPQLMRDEKDLEDAAREGNELFLDCCESLRYGLYSYYNPRKAPQHVLDDQRIKSIPDPTWKYMEHLRQQARAPANDLVINVPRRTAPWRRN